MNEVLYRIYSQIEEGKLLFPIQLMIIGITSIAIMISGIEFSTKEITTVFKSDEVKMYHIKKVSHIPKEIEDDEAEKIAVEDDKISIEDVRNRYFSYIIAKIENVKEYPLSEQKKGHEGSVLIKMYVTREGRVRKVKILQQARYMVLTKAAITSIRRALPFQPFPERLPDEELVLKLEIRFYLQ